MTREEAANYAKWLLHATNESKATQSYAARLVADRTGASVNAVKREVYRCQSMPTLQALEVLTASIWMAGQADAA